MAYNFYFVHGWGFGEEFWFPLCKLLKKKDIGFIKIVNIESFNKKIISRVEKKRIFITHSFGLSWFLKNKISCHALVNFFSAPNFVEFQKKPEKTKKVLELMIKNIEKSPDEVMKKFYINCGLENYILNKNINYKKLRNNLISLKEDNLVSDFRNLKIKILSVLSYQDKIFEPSFEKIKKLNNENHQIKILKKKNHAFPYLEPDKAFEIIYKFIKTI